MTTAAPRDLLRQELIRDEGFRTMPYRDSRGYLTIGVGRNLDASGLSAAEVYMLLDNDIDSAIRACVSAFPWFPALDAVRQGVLVQMAFNLGIVGLKQFTQTLAAVARGDYRTAAAQMLQSRWAQQVGGRAARLAAQMETGAYA